VPEESRKYFHTVCVAGITDYGELRRLYPVPFKPLLAEGGIPFHKRDWIQATVHPPEDRRDKRKESRKVDMQSIQVLGNEDYVKIREIIRKHLSPSISAIRDSGASLGFIKPRIVDYECEIESTEPVDKSQLDLQGRPLGKIKLGQTSRYTFFCEESKKCCGDRPHCMEIHDWEANELYRNIIQKDKKHAAIKDKMKQKWYGWMTTERDIYFMMGTHHLWKVWMIVSVLYPPRGGTTLAEFFE